MVRTNDSKLIHSYQTLPVFDVIFRKIFCIRVVNENYASIHFITHSLILIGPLVGILDFSIFT